MQISFFQQKQRWLSLFVAVVFAVTSWAGVFSSQVYAFDKADNAYGIYFCFASFHLMQMDQ